MTNLTRDLASDYGRAEPVAAQAASMGAELTKPNLMGMPARALGKRKVSEKMAKIMEHNKHNLSRHQDRTDNVAKLHKPIKKAKDVPHGERRAIKFILMQDFRHQLKAGSLVGTPSTCQKGPFSIRVKKRTTLERNRTAAPFRLS